MPLRSLRSASPFAARKGTGVGAFDSPFGGILFDGCLSKDRRVFGVACESQVVSSSIVQHRRRRQTVGPPGGVSERSAPVIARLFLSLVLQPLPSSAPERRVPGRETVRPDLERASPCERSSVETCSCPRASLPGSRLRGTDFGSAVARGRPLGSRPRLGNSVWLAMVSSEPAVLLRIRALQLQRSS